MSSKPLTEPDHFYSALGERVVEPALSWLRRVREAIYCKLIKAPLHRRFFTDLINKTGNFSNVTWLGQPIWQNVLDLWTIQETIFETRPELLIESGTNRGGSALFYAHLFDLIGRGRVISVDIEKMHQLAHPRVTFLTGSSVDASVLQQIDATVRPATGPIMVILDSDHSMTHVRSELERYAGFVTPGSYLLVQDGVIDVLPKFREGRPGPLPAVQAFLKDHPEFEIDHQRNGRFLITHHPMGWLRRRHAESSR